jgi:transposase-like protein
VEEKMGTKRKQHSAEFKFKVALEAAKEQKTLSQLGSEYELHPTQISEWKRQLLSGGMNVFGKSESKSEKEQSKVELELYEQIGRLKMELEWLKKKSCPQRLRRNVAGSRLRMRASVYGSSASGWG